jgi:hypothetical protein
MKACHRDEAAGEAMYPQVRKLLGCRLVENECLIVFEKSGQDHALVLNHAAARAFTLMDGGHSLDEIARVLAQDRNGNPHLFQEAVRGLAGRLKRLGIVATQGRPWSEPCGFRLPEVQPVVEDEQPQVVAEEQLEVVAGSPSPVGGCGTAPASPNRQRPTR